MKRRKLFGIVALFGLAALVGTLYNRAIKPPSLFSKQNQRLAIVPWVLDKSNIGTQMEDRYTWLNNDTLLYFLRDTKGIDYAVTQRVEVGQTFAVNPLPKVTTALAIEEIKVSPNRQLLLIRGTDTHDKMHLQIVALDGRGTLQDYSTKDCAAFWLSDSQTVVGSVAHSGQLVRYSAKTHRQDFTATIPRYAPYPVIAPDGTYYACEVHSIPPQTVDLECGSVHTGRSRTRSLFRPEDSYDLTLEGVTAQGNRLLWREPFNPVSSLSRWWSILTGRPATTADVMQWYVTDINGANRHNVSSLTYPSESAELHVAEYVQPRWLPDGKHVSMIYKGALYVVPVP